MGALITTPNITRTDDVHQLLVDAYAGLADEQIAPFHARLLLLLINHVGDGEAVAQAISAAMPGGGPRE